MPMDKDRLGDAIVARIQALNGNVDAGQLAILQPFWRAIADEIINEIKANMDITTAVTVPGVTSGPTTVFGTGQDTTII